MSPANAQREGFIPEPQAQPQPQDDNTVLDMATGAPVPEPPEEVWPIKVKLMHHPIRDNKGIEVTELLFREPTGADINRYGNPVRINMEGDIIIDERKMTWMMAALSGVLSPMLERMDPRDWNSCAYRLRSFFLPDPSAW
jgi:hypothetical protein